MTINKNSANSILADFDELREVAFGSITGSYTLIGPLFENAVRQIKVINETDGKFYVSYDGIKNQDAITAGSQFINDISSNRSEQGGLLVFPSRKGFYIKTRGAAPTTGSVLISVMFAE